jgi:ATP-dependent Clp protease ATP-binding subunit ClpX
VERNLRCSFCGRSEHEVEKLVAGPSVHICDACVGRAHDIIQRSSAPPSVPAQRSGLATRLRAALSELGSRLRLSRAAPGARRPLPI